MLPHWGAHIPIPTVWLVDALSYTNWCLPGSKSLVWVLPVGIKPPASSVVPQCIKPQNPSCLHHADTAWLPCSGKTCRSAISVRTHPPHSKSILELTLNVQDASHRKMLSCSIPWKGGVNFFKQLVMAAKSFFCKRERQKRRTCS